jgi:hypothetical protein
MKATCIAPEHVALFWPQVYDYIAAAFETGLGDDTIESVKADLDAGNSLLWVAHDDIDIRAAATTKIMEYSARKVCVVTACGGKNLPEWIQCLGDIEHYAKAEGAIVRIMGRQGWKILKTHGYKEPWVCLEKVP